MSSDELFYARLRVDNALERGTSPDEIAADIAMYLLGDRGWTGANAANRRARELVERRVPIVAERLRERARGREIAACEADLRKRLGEAAALLRACGYTSATTKHWFTLELTVDDAERLAALARAQFERNLVGDE